MYSFCTHIHHSEGFFEEAKPFISSDSSLLYYSLPLLSIFFSSYNLTICFRENPAKIPVWQKNPPKYNTAYIVQQSNCRWHCEPTFFLGCAFNKEKSLHILPFQAIHSYLSISTPPSLNPPSCLLGQFDY